jgi:hypothetical protein
VILKNLSVLSRNMVFEVMLDDIPQKSEDRIFVDSSETLLLGE